MKELEETDNVIGLDLQRRETTFEKITSRPKKLKAATLVRITTDVNEIIVPENAQLYLIGGKRIASSVAEGDEIDIFYRPQTFKMLRGLYDSNQVQYLQIGSNKTEVSEQIAYLLGTQSIVQEWLARKIVMYLESDVNWRKICSILKRALHEAGLQYDVDYRIFYRADRQKIIISDESPDRLIISMISGVFQPDNPSESSHMLPKEMPKAIRLSPTNTIKQFMEGMLDSRTKISKGGLVKFYTFARDSEIRRFVFSILALLGIQPRYTFVSEPEWGLTIMTTYLALPKERPFDLKSLAIASEGVLANRTKNDVKTYSMVRSIGRLRRFQYVVPCPKEHWDIIADLVPIHSQRVSPPA